jgi:hypothetical protein
MVGTVRLSVASISRPEDTLLATGVMPRCTPARVFVPASTSHRIAKTPGMPLGPNLRRGPLVNECDLASRCSLGGLPGRKVASALRPRPMEATNDR